MEKMSYQLNLKAKKKIYMMMKKIRMETIKNLETMEKTPQVLDFFTLRKK